MSVLIVLTDAARGRRVALGGADDVVGDRAFVHARDAHLHHALDERVGDAEARALEPLPQRMREVAGLQPPEIGVAVVVAPQGRRVLPAPAPAKRATFRPAPSCVADTHTVTRAGGRLESNRRKSVEKLAICPRGQHLHGHSRRPKGPIAGIAGGRNSVTP